MKEFRPRKIDWISCQYCTLCYFHHKHHHSPNNNHYNKYTQNHKNKDCYHHKFHIQLKNKNLHHHLIFDMVRQFDADMILAVNPQPRSGGYANIYKNGGAARWTGDDDRNRYPTQTHGQTRRDWSGSSLSGFRCFSLYGWFWIGCRWWSFSDIEKQVCP